MGYKETIEANGVVVKDYHEFGSYQGTWIAVLEDGRYIEGSYGSCSGCDAFEAEFSWSNERLERQSDGKFYSGNWKGGDEISEESALENNRLYDEKFKAFGKSYLDSAETKEEMIARYEIKCQGEYAWDDDKEILYWLTHKL